MSLRPSARRLVSMLDLIEQVERVGGARELTVFGIRCGEWLPFDAPIPLPDGSAWHERGYLLPSRGPRARYLLEGGRVLEVPEAAGSEPRVRALVEASELAAEIATALRPHIIRFYLGGSLEEMEGPTVPAVVGDLLAVAWEAEAGGREAIFGALAEAHRDASGWRESAARLKSAFERGLGDRSRRVQTVSARALLRMAAGLAPLPPGNQGTRVLEVLLGMPRDPVKAATFSALLDLDRDRLEPFAETLEPLLREASASAQAEIRELAGELQLKLADGSAAWSISRALESADGRRRAEALAALEGSPQSNFEVLMPKVLDALADRDPNVRDAAIAVVAPQIEAAPLGVWKRVVVTLLGAEDPEASQAGVRFLRQRWEALEAAPPAPGDPDQRVLAELKAGPAPGSEIWRALRDALDIGPEAGAAKALLWLDLHADLEAEQLTQAFLTLIHHRDPGLRQVALRELAERPTDRQLVKDGLFKSLVEHLQDASQALRLETARAIIALGYPHADEIVSQLLLEPSPQVRAEVLALLQAVASPERLARARADDARIDLLYRVASLHEPHARREWSKALQEMGGRPGARVSQLLAAVLGQIPADTPDLFLQQCIDEIDALILARTEGGEDLLALCRRLMEPPDPRPGHAMRLAGKIAAQDMRGLGFLWTCYTTTRGAPAKAAQQALLSLAPLSKSREVTAELNSLLRRSHDPAARHLLERMLGRRR